MADLCKRFGHVESVRSVDRFAEVSGDMGPLYSFSDSQIGNADGDGRAAVRCVWRPFLFRVCLSEESVGKGEGLRRRVCVFGVGASRAAFDAEGAAAFDGLRGHRGLWRMGAFGKVTMIRTWTVRKRDA